MTDRRIVWLHFTKLSSERGGQCNYCKHKIKSGNLDRFESHLRNCKKATKPVSDLFSVNARHRLIHRGHDRIAEDSKEDTVQKLKRSKYAQENDPSSCQTSSVRHHKTADHKKRIWVHFSRLAKGERGGQCNYCKHILNAGNLDRFESHLRNCKKATNEVKDLFPANNAQHLRNRIASDNKAETVPDAKMPKCTHKIDSATAAPLTERIDEKIADFFFKTAIPFRIADSKAFKDMIELICPSYTHPKQHNLTHALLDQKYESLQNDLKMFIQQSERISLVSDGWANIRNDHIVNFVLWSPTLKESFFYKAVSLKNEVQDASHNEQLIEACIKSIGVQKISSIISDNVPIMTNTLKKIEEKFPHIFTIGCSNHALNLLVKDLLSIDKIYSDLEKSLFVSKYVSEKSILSKEYRKLVLRYNSNETSTKLKCLSLPDETTWISNCDVMTNVFNGREILENISRNKDLMARCQAINPVQEINKTFVETVNNDAFFKSLSLSCEVLQHVSKCIGVLELDNACVSDIYQIFCDLEVEYSKEAKYGMQLSKMLQGAVRIRFDSIRTFESMRFGFLLNPKNKGGVGMIGTDKRDTILQLTKFGAKNAVSFGIEVNEFNDEIMQFLMDMSCINPDEFELIRLSSALQWWSIFGKSKYSNLGKVAVALLCIPTTPIASNRVWNAYDFVHTKLSNQVENDRVDKLVFIYANSSLKNDHRMIYEMFDDNNNTI